MATKVYYNNVQITPAPFVARSYEPINNGHRFGVVETFELRGTYTGNNDDYSTTVSGIINLFSGQFRNFKVETDAMTVIDVNNAILDELTIADSQYLVGAPISYSARLRTHHVPTGVVDPVNEYSFNENGDEVTVVHKISAQGVKTNLSALQNAFNYVEDFIGQNPYTFCTPYFINNSSGILFSQIETVDRLGGSYSVTETYKYNTGVGTGRNYLMNMTLDLSEGIQEEYNVVDVNVTYRGSRYGDLSGLRNSINAVSLAQQVQDYYGVASNTLTLNTLSVDETSGENTISVKASFYSGAASDITGYFGYEIQLSVDEIKSLQTYTINGKFESRGTLNKRREAVENFLTSVNGDYESFLYGKITGSSLYSVFQDSNHPLCNQIISLGFSYDTGRADLSMNGVFDNRDCLDFAQVVGYNVNVEASKPVFKLVPSANIEGHYVIQDLQCNTLEKTTISTSCTSSGMNESIETELRALVDVVSGQIFGTNETTVISNSATTGKFDGSREISLFSEANISLKTNMKDSLIGPYSTRNTSTKFGY